MKNLTAAVLLAGVTFMSLSSAEAPPTPQTPAPPVLAAPPDASAPG